MRLPYEARLIGLDFTHFFAFLREYCSCGNAYPNLKPNMFDKMVDTRCNYACDGNSSQKCGGEWPLKSVYETGIERK